jgi:hypothetical protein
MQMKKIFYLMAVAIMVMGFTACSDSDDDNVDNYVQQLETNPDDQTAYTVKTVPVNRDGNDGGTVAIRFYVDMPSVPYISVADFQNIMVPGTTVSVTKTGTGTYQLKNAGSTLTVNTVTETCAFDDFLNFTNQMGLVQEGIENVCYDGLPFVRFNHQTLSGGSPAVTFNYSSYGINLRADDAAVYFPFATLADLYADFYGHNAACNGEKVVYASIDSADGGIGALDEDFKKENLMKHNERKADMAAYNYAELCFAIDHFYGMPAGTDFEKSIQEKGLDKTLEANADGQIVKQLLLSTNIDDYADGMCMLYAYLFDEGHTTIWFGNPSTTFAEKYPSLYNYFDERVTVPTIKKGLQYGSMTLPERELVFGDKNTYHKKGNTAICHFDSFSGNDKQAWKDYYQGKGPRPTLATSPGDPMAIFLDALEQAVADPEVKNFVLDLTANLGGSSDVVMAMTSVMFNQNFFRAYNVITKQKMEWHFDVDRNFDGKYDALDKDVHYDLNYCIVAGPLSFSCGNLFPSLCKDAGLLLVGQKSGGGSCAVGSYRTADGFYYKISSARGRLCDQNWQNINDGITPNVTIDYAKQGEFPYEGHNYTIYSYKNFWDFDLLSSIISEYYKQ